MEQKPRTPKAGGPLIIVHPVKHQSEQANNSEQKEKGRTFAELAKSITELHEKKNADYGNAFAVLYSRKEEARRGAGLEYAATRIFEKASRVENISMNDAQVKSESIVDTLLDIAAYALMTVEEYEKWER